MFVQEMTGWLHRERTIAGGSPYVTSAGSRAGGTPNDGSELARPAEELGIAGDTRALERIGEAQALTLVGDAMVRSVTAKMQTGALPHHAAAMLRLFNGTATVRSAAIALELAVGAGVVWAPDEARRAQAGVGYLVRQA